MPHSDQFVGVSEGQVVTLSVSIGFSYRLCACRFYIEILGLIIIVGNI